MHTTPSPDTHVSPLAAQVLVPAQAQLGECPLWCDREQALYWTDIDSARLSRWSAADGALQHWELPERLGSFALCERPGRLLLGLASGLAFFDLSSGAVGPVHPVEPERPNTRINDGRCDAEGRFVFGMYAEDGQSCGGFYRAGPDLRIEQLPLPPVAVANCTSFSPDGRRMYCCDSPRRLIWQLDYPVEGPPGPPQRFAQLAEEDGEPDGAAVDAQGGLWTALWGAGCVLRFDAQGREQLRLSLPASQPTCPVFGGAALERLFISSACKNTADKNPAETLAGAIFELPAAALQGLRGLPAARFRTP